VADQGPPQQDQHLVYLVLPVVVEVALEPMVLVVLP
jgi:hypothetical protein